MPSNLNALIRYKTIDRCLSNPYRKWSIGDLVEACSEALKEYRGISSGISERTVREDIRVMRSDILGFNAPIIQSGGHYFYEEPDYSIFNVSVRDSQLFARVLEFMLEIRSEVDHPEIDRIIGIIRRAKPEEIRTGEPDQEFMTPGIAYEETILRDSMPEEITWEDNAIEETIRKDSPPAETAGFYWSMLLGLIK